MTGISDDQVIPEDIMVSAEKALDNVLCNCVESCGGADGLWKASIEEIAKALLAERQRNAQPRKRIIEAMCELPHSIDDDRVEFRFNPRRPGHNALNQLITQLEVRFGTSKDGV